MLSAWEEDYITVRIPVISDFTTALATDVLAGGKVVGTSANYPRITKLVLVLLHLLRKCFCVDLCIYVLWPLSKNIKDFKVHLYHLNNFNDSKPTRLSKVCRVSESAYYSDI